MLAEMLAYPHVEEVRELRSRVRLLARRTAATSSRAPTRLRRRPPIPLTEPVQQWRDLLDLGGEDRREAAERLRLAVLDRALPRPR